MDDTSLNEIKSMVETFSIKEEKFINQTYYLNLGVSFNKKRVFSYLEQKNIFPTQIIKEKFLFIPIIVDQEDLAGDSSPALTTVPEIKIKKQVFHIPDNKYSYPDAKAVCNAYGGRLATWKEINKAFKKGADWCGMGWSEGQMALYPTQYDKWENLQKIKGHENDCGRPGINGGFIMNPRVRFGVNCYGHKPKITQYEAELMEENKEYPITRRSLAYENRVEYWKTKINDILVSPFNRNSWSRI